MIRPIAHTSSYSEDKAIFPLQPGLVDLLRNKLSKTLRNKLPKTKLVLAVEMSYHNRTRPTVTPVTVYQHCLGGQLSLSGERILDFVRQR